MKYLLIIVVLVLSGCANSDANILLNTDKKPPAYFTITDKKTMDKFEFNTKKFYFKFPTSKQSDFKQIGKWHGVSIRDGHTISFGLDMYYSISISTGYKVREYTKRERALENGTRKFRPQRTKSNGDTININTHIEHHGKENYSCVVSESIDRFNRYRIGYRCHKFNQSKTKYRSVLVRLGYPKPKKPTLAKQYTYTDLKRRAKRMLDSLYIKDGW